MEINWTDLGLSLLPDHLLQKTTGHQTILPMPFVKHKGRTEIHLPENIEVEPHFDNELIKGICLGFKYQKMMDQKKMSIADLAITENTDASHIGRLLRLTSLSPTIIRTILNGHLPPKFYLRNLLRKTIPPIWDDQVKQFGFTILD